MSGKLAKMSEKSDFEIFVPIPLCFLFSWPCSTELTLKKIMPLNLLSEKKKSPSILLRSEEVTNLFSLSEEVAGGRGDSWMVLSVREAEPRLAAHSPLLLGS